MPTRPDCGNAGPVSTQKDTPWLCLAPAAGETLHPRAPAPGRWTSDETVESLLAVYRDAVDRANAVIDTCADLTEPVARPARDGKPPSMRWALVHMIEETGRHAGHADILRELIDGSTGR